MEDLIRGSAPTAFREKGFWDEFYQRRGDAAFEWYGTWPDVARLVLRHADPALPALVLGCGNSTLSQDMHHAGGFASVTSIDFSEEVVAAMRSKTQTMDGLHWAVMDMTHLQYDNESFGCVMDKGALDALYAADEDAIAEDVSRMFREVQRVLRPGGAYLCITMAQDYVLQRLLQHFAGPGWGVDLHTFAPSDGTAAPAFLVALTKGGTGLWVDDGVRAAESDAPDGDVDVAAALQIVAEYQERRYRALTAAAGALEVRHDAQDFAAATQQRRDDDDDEADGLHLSAATLAALADFAVERGILQADQVNAQTLLMDVTRGCDVADREDQWAYRFGDVSIELRGVKRELGQTLTWGQLSKAVDLKGAGLIFLQLLMGTTDTTYHGVPLEEVPLAQAPNPHHWPDKVYAKLHGLAVLCLTAAHTVTAEDLVRTMQDLVFLSGTTPKDCMVCMDACRAVRLPCGHCTTCEGCAQDMLRTGAQCPLCRAAFLRWDVCDGSQTFMPLH